jgi:hypothetical protein
MLHAKKNEEKYNFGLKQGNSQRRSTALAGRILGPQNCADERWVQMTHSRIQQLNSVTGVVGKPLLLNGVHP